MYTATRVVVIFASGRSKVIDSTGYPLDVTETESVYRIADPSGKERVQSFPKRNVESFEMFNAKVKGLLGDR